MGLRGTGSGYTAESQYGVLYLVHYSPCHTIDVMHNLFLAIYYPDLLRIGTGSGWYEEDLAL